MLLNSKKFSAIIEDIVKTKKISYIDAIVKYCEDNEMDPSNVGSLISKSLKDKINFKTESGVHNSSSILECDYATSGIRIDDGKCVVPIPAIR